MPKRKCAFTNDLKREYPYLKEAVNDKVHCNQCMAVFSISHDGRSDINKHLQTQKHKSSIEAAASSSRVTNFFKLANSDQSLKLAAKEATLAYHTTIHGQTLKSSDCASKLISKFFESKLALSRTKREAVIVNCIAPMVTADLRQELGRANFVTVTIDASNMKKIKLVPVVVRYFVPDIGVKVKLLEFKSLAGETAENYRVLCLEQNELKEKLLGFVRTTATPILEA